MSKPVSFWLALCAALVTAQAQSGPNPATRAEDVEAGGRAFRSHCAECHGRTGEGGRGPALNTGEFHHGSRDEDLFRNISKGIPGTEMPGIYFTDHQIWPLVSFVRSLATAGRRQAPPGRAELGRQIYWGKGGCSGCHAVLGRGGLQGPDLSVIGSQRTPDHLMESLVKPEARVPRVVSRMTRAPGRSANTVGEATPFHGYSYRVLAGTGNLALVAYPAEYRTSGVMTFAVTRKGAIYEKDLGQGTAGLAQNVKTQKEISGWSEVK